MTDLKRRLEQIINGKFEYEPPKLVLSKESVEETVKTGENFQEKLSVKASDGRKISGYVISDNRRILVSRENFADTGSMTFVYGVDMAGLMPGEKVEGHLYLTTSIGEAQIPIGITLEREQVCSSVGEIADMEAFTNLVRRDSREAYLLFRNQETFAPVLKKMDARGRALYEGMSQNMKDYQQMEEFLIGMNQKEPVSVWLKEEKGTFWGVQESIREFVAIQKDGWGHVSLEVETEGDFLEVAKKNINEEDFIGSLYHLDYVIRKEKLGNGKNFGRIRLKGPYQNLVYQVTASLSKEKPSGAEEAGRKYGLQLFRAYVGLRSHKMDYKTWLEETKGILKKLKAAGLEYPEYQMYEAYMLYQEEDIQGAVEILNKYRKKTFTSDELELAGVYIYLCSRLGMFREKHLVVQKLHNFYVQKENSFPLFWVWSRMDEELQNSPTQLAFAMEELFDKGCCSPLLYLEAWKLISKNMSLLRRVSGLWTQVFLYAGKEKLLTEELSMRLAYLSGYEKGFSRSLYRALTYAYRAYPSDDTLEAVCKYIMKGNPRDREYFPWFALAVERGLRLTRLYEYYMETLDTSHQRELPKTLLLYFAYNNSSLNDTAKAFLFANIIANREKEPEIYASYRSSIEEFALQKLKQGKMNEDYAVIYQEFCMNPRSLEEGNSIGKMLFTCRLYCGDSRIRKVIIRHSQLDKEEEYPCIHGVAYPRIYTEDAAVIFQDDRQIRYASTVNYNLKKLLDEREAADHCLELGVAQPGLLLYASEKQRVRKETLELFQVLAGLEDFSADYRRRIRQELLSYYESHLQEEEVEDSLRAMKYSQFASVDKQKLLEILIDAGLYPQALGIIRQVGCEGVSSEKLVKMVSRLIIQREFEEEEELLALAGQVYQEGKYDEVILNYLMKYQKGPVKQLISLWDSARKFRMDTYDLEERILETLMDTWDYQSKGAEIFQNYIRQTGKEYVVSSYLTFVSYGYFVYGCELSPFIEKCLKIASRRQWKLDFVCSLALLEVLSKKEKLSASEERMAEKILEECQIRGLAFAFFQNLPARILELYQLEDKTFVEYRTNPHARVVLHYALDTGLGRAPEFQSEPLRELYQGVFLKTFTLFYGETLQYYFTVELDGKKEKTAVKTFVMNHTDKESKSKYQLLNRILSAWRLSKGPEAAGLLQDYLRQEQYKKCIYTIEKES